MRDSGGDASDDSNAADDESEDTVENPFTGAELNEGVGDGVQIVDPVDGAKAREASITSDEEALASEQW